MKNRIAVRLLPHACTLMCAFGFFSIATRASATIDTAVNLTVWKLFYNLTDAQVNDPAWLAADDDGDGLTNGAELAAGTNPESSKSMVEVTSTTMDLNYVYLGFPTAKGKLYSLESTNALSAPNWAPLQPVVQVTGDGTSKTLAAPLTSGVFFHVVVQDLDTDGDGVSDWAESVAGYDPNNAHTKNSPTDDHTSITTELPKENIVTITASVPSAVQPPDALTAATSSGSFTVSRGGTLNFSTTSVPLTSSGTAISDTDYVALPSSVTFSPKVGVIIVPVVPKYNAARQNNAVVTLQATPGAGYAVSSPNSASVVISPAGNATGTGLRGDYFKPGAALLPPAAFNESAIFATSVANRTDATVDSSWNSSSLPSGFGTTTNFAIRWTGQVLPQYTETYYFTVKSDDGVKLWINGQLIIDKWATQGNTEWTGAIDLIGGLLYDIKLEYFYTSGGSAQTHLNWYSNSQVKQVIPTSRLYPVSATAVPTVVSSQVAYGFVNQPFSYKVVATNAASLSTSYSLGTNSGILPPGLSLNASTGFITGTPTQAGDYQVAIVATNPNGSGSSVLDIKIFDTGNAITREVWTSGVTGSSVADIPTNLAPNTTDTSLHSLEDNTAYADNTAKRLRGYFTAPTTGNYYFWLAASNAAELWIANDNQYATKVRRAWVNAPGTNSETWNTQTNQKSGWLSLVAGQKHYFEVLHNHGVGTVSDNVAVGYFLDPTGTTANPIANGSGVVPGYLLSPYDYPSVASTTDTLYATNLQPQGTAFSAATGSASLRLNAAHTQAILHFSYSGLSSPRTAYHIHTEAIGNNPSQIVFDLDDVDKFHPELKTADGGYIWNIVDVGTWTADGIVNAILIGQTYLNIHTVNYPAGEIKGDLTQVFGSQTPPTLQADPGYTDDHGTDAGAARFLNQATFGASPSDVTYVKANGYSAWIDNQFTLLSSDLVPDVLANVQSDPNNLYPDTLMFNAWWRRSVLAPDQLRQRVAFALSEIFVVSDVGILNNNGRILADFYDTLLDNAFGNFRDIMKQVTLTPAMGLYLDMRGNAKGDLTTGVHPNENYAREVMQLFSLGLNKLWPDGTLVLDSAGNLVPTYNQDVITGVARVFTGWNYGQDLQANGRLPTSFSPAANYLDPMVLVPTKHELGSKIVLDNVVLPPAQGYTIAGGCSDSNLECSSTQTSFDTYCLNDLDKAIDTMFNNSSVGPFICRQLIQRLVSSNPSSGYLYRVVQKFNDDGSAQHVRGNMQAVIKAILLDGEARSTTLPAAIANVSGKQREPLLRLTGPARAFPVVATTGTYSQSGGTILNITTTTPHLLSSGNAVFLDFTGNTPIQWNNPTTTNYTVLSNPAPTVTTFSVNATGLLSNAGTAYTQLMNSNTITVNNAGPAAVGAEVYLYFTTGGAPSGIYTVASLPDSSHFTVTTTEDPATIPARNGLVLLPKLSGGYAIKNSGSPSVATITVGTFGNHNLQVNDKVWMDFSPSSGSLNTDAEFTVSSIVDEDHFTIVVPNPSGAIKSETLSTLTVYMLVPPPLTRSGNVSFQTSKYDVGFSTDLLMTPLNSPTVFNFYYPNFEYPGTLSANNVTTPEFQLTTDTNVITLTNTLASAILSSSNTNGLTSYRSGGGSITMDLSPYMTPTQTSNSGIPALVDQLGNLLTGGLTSSTRTAIINFVANNTNFNYTTPTQTQMRDRVRAVVHMIIVSPEYAIQR